MVHRFVFHNDRLLPINEVRLSPGQAGLMSGWGLFTTMRIVEGIPFAFERHWQRLTRDAEKTHCPFPFEEADSAVSSGRGSSCQRSARGMRRAFTRFTTRPAFGAATKAFPTTDLLIYSAGLPSSSGPRAAWSARARAPRGVTLSRVKVTSWLNNVWNLI